MYYVGQQVQIHIYSKWNQLREKKVNFHSDYPLGGVEKVRLLNFLLLNE